MERYIKQTAYVILLILLMMFMYGLVIAYRKMNTPVIEIRELPVTSQITPALPPAIGEDKPVCLSWGTIQTKGGHLRVCNQWKE